MRTAAWVLLLFLSTQLSGQQQTEGLPISIGYFGNFLIQPGVKIGTQFSIKNWQKEKTGKKTFTRSSSLLISPQLGLFTRIGDQTSFLLNGELGYKRQKLSGGLYTMFSAGLGYLSEHQIQSVKISLTDGRVTEKEWAQSSYFMPNLGFEFGHAFSPRLGWYNKYTYGLKINPDEESSTLFFVELGLRYYL